MRVSNLKRRLLPVILLVLILAAAACGKAKDSEWIFFGDDDFFIDDDTTPAGAEDCADCHVSETAAWENGSSHQSVYTCADCHEKLASEPGIGHRASPWCDNCHSEATHNPTYFPGDESFRFITCLTCHDPHGSPNRYMIQPKISLGGGEFADVTFLSIDGQAADSYATPRGEEGRGLCEVCHTRTRFYLSNGEGEAHFTNRCTDCHDHAVGFSEQ